MKAVMIYHSMYYHGPRNLALFPLLKRENEKGVRLSMRRDDFKRWLYRGQRPNWIARMENRVWAALFSWGLLPDYMVTLEVSGRKSGRTITLPVAIAVVNGERYLVSMLGENVQWVHNVRAAGGRAVLRRHGREEVHLEEVPAEQRGPILKAYLQRAPGARPHVPVNKAAPLAAFEQIATAFPVFHVVKDIHASAGRSVHEACQQGHRS